MGRFALVLTMLAAFSTWLYLAATYPRQPITTFESYEVNFTTAKNFVMPWGEHKTKTLDKIAETDKGLLWLDWMRGNLEKRVQRSSLESIIYCNLVAYLNDQTISKEVDAAMARRG